MIAYICIGLGVFLSIYVSNLANPEADLGFGEGIAIFLFTLFTWPLTLLANLSQALRVREETKIVQEAFNELLKLPSDEEPAEEKKDDEQS